MIIVYIDAYSKLTASDCPSRTHVTPKQIADGEADVL